MHSVIVPQMVADKHSIDSRAQRLKHQSVSQRAERKSFDCVYTRGFAHKRSISTTSSDSSWKSSIASSSKSLNTPRSTIPIKRHLIPRQHMPTINLPKSTSSSTYSRDASLSPAMKQKVVRRPKEIQCWYYLYDTCKFGNRCVNAHDEPTLQSQVYPKRNEYRGHRRGPSQFRQAYQAAPIPHPLPQRQQLVSRYQAQFAATHQTDLDSAAPWLLEDPGLFRYAMSFQTLPLSPAESSTFSSVPSSVESTCSSSIDSPYSAPSSQDYLPFPTQNLVAESQTHSRLHDTLSPDCDFHSAELAPTKVISIDEALQLHDENEYRMMAYLDRDLRAFIEGVGVEYC